MAIANLGNLEMKKVLLGTTAVACAGLVASPAFAADGIKLGLGGYFRTAYMVVFDDDDEGELGNEANTDGIFSDGEIYFTGSTVLDNGLEVGARVELEAEQDTDQIDEAWVFFSGGFGEIHIGSEDDALANNCLLPPGGTGNFSAFSPNQWGANNAGLVASPIALTSNTACTGVDDRGDAQKVLYVTPNFAGFQLALSYTPNGGDEFHNGGHVGGPHTGMPVNLDGESRHNLAGYLTYSFAGDGWGIDAGAGASFEGHVEQQPGPNRKEQDFYQAAVNLTFGNFAIGGVFEYFNDLFSFNGVVDGDAWVAGGGIAYTMDAFTVGAQYSHQDAEFDSVIGDLDTTMDRIVLTGDYAMGPGINLDASVGYTWVDTDPELAAGFDDYDAFEIGLGTRFTF
ncbi:porin [Dongia deserti]|uniref:porin n=1 Tax=Dongia deserti TaxID=2268030 RepID=UPI0013C4D72E|nr:porin [Dongia deserti]